MYEMLVASGVFELVPDEEELVAVEALYPGRDQTDNMPPLPQNSVTSSAQSISQSFCGTDAVEMLLSQ